MPKGEKNKKLFDTDIQEIVRLYTTRRPDGLWNSGSMIAKRFKVTDTLIHYHLNRLCIPKRSLSEVHVGWASKPITHIPVGDPPLCKCGCGLATPWSQRQNKWLLYAPGHYRKDKPYKHPEWLRSEYVDKHRSLIEIADACGVNPSVVVKAMKKLGISRRSTGESLILRQTARGSKNPAWRGGITPERQAFYRSREWVEVVKLLWRRDKASCQRCGFYANGHGELCAHHVKSFSVKELRSNLDNLVLLCPTCHLFVHSKKNTKREFLR